MREIKSLTGLRGIAALYVVLFHYVNFDPAYGPAWLIDLIGHGYISVDLFFVLSGFVMALSYGRLFEAGSTWNSFLVFLGRRLARIYPLYAVVTVILALAVLSGHSDRLRLGDLRTVLPANLLMVQSWTTIPDLEAPMWSISTEWAAYLVFPLLVAMTGRSRAGALVAVALALGGLVVLSLTPGWSFSHPERRDGPLSLFGAPSGMLGRCFAEFTLGLVAYRLARSDLGRRLSGDGRVASLLVLLIASLLPFTLSDLALVACFTMLIVALSADHGPVARVLASRPLATLGVWSYAIYLVHPLIRRLAWHLGAVFEAHGLPRHAAAWGGLAVSLPILLALSALAHVAVERPGRTAIQHLISREWLGRRVVASGTSVQDRSG